MDPKQAHLIESPWQYCIHYIVFWVGPQFIFSLLLKEKIQYIYLCVYDFSTLSGLAIMSCKSIEELNMYTIYTIFMPQLKHMHVSCIIIKFQKSICHLATKLL
jgi:hypothetical protein